MEMDGPVTVVIHHRVIRGKESAFEEWLRGIIQAAAGFDGYLGYNVVRPSDPKHPEYVVFFRFSSFALLEKWEVADIRHEWLAKLDAITIHPPTWERQTGLEVWFTPKPGQATPPRWKLAAVTLMTIYPLILLVHFLLGPLMADLNVFVRSLIGATLLVGTMTYLAMPLMTQLFARWLYEPEA